MKTSTQAYRELKAASFALPIACADFGTAAFAQDWEQGPQGKQPPRATLVATPIPVRRATLVATPTPVPRAMLIATPPPVQRAALISTATSSATPLLSPTPNSTSSTTDKPPDSTWHQPELTIGVPTPVPVPVASAPQTQTPAMPWGGTVLAIVLVAGFTIASVIVNRDARRAAKKSVETPKKPKAIIYHDYDQYQLARQAWLDRSRSFAQQEAARLAALETKLKQGGALSGLGCLGFILLTLLFGTAGGAGAGWGTVIVGVFVVALLGACEQQYRRWRWRDQFKPRLFADAVPEPVYEEPPRQSSPPPREEPPPRQESAPSPPPVEQVCVTSLRQAFEILEMPPGRTTLSMARAAYRARMAEYHPDKTLHLGKELRELAARKALAINLAMKFIEENCTRDPVVPGQSTARSSEPPGPKAEPGTQVLIDQIRRFKNAVPFRPFSIKTRRNDRVMSTSDKLFFIRYPEWVSLEDETSIVLRNNDADHKCVIPLQEIQQVCLGGNETETRWENASDRKTEQTRSGNENSSIYPEDSIVSASEDDPRRIFVRGPFDDLDDDAFCDPYVPELDYTERSGRAYISINSWRRRISCGTDEDALLGNEILEFAARGGWDWDNDYSYEEVYCGGADVIPHYVTKRIAAGLRNFLRMAPNEIEFEGRRISRDILFRAADILEAGPTTIPW